MAKPLVSVIVVNFNRKAFLLECLASIRSQDLADYELIVVDNGSDDGSRELLAAYPHIKYVPLDRNTGFTGGNIAGLCQAQGRYIALINNDVTLSADWIREHVRAMEENPTAGSTASKIIRHGDPQALDCAGDGMTTSCRGVKLFEGRDPAETVTPRWVFGSSAAAALYRRAMLDDIGFLDPRFFFNCEDTDLGFRAQLAGWKCLFVHQATALHRVNGSHALLGNKAVFYWSRNSEMLWLKNMPLRLLLRYFHHHVIHEGGAFLKNLHRPGYALQVALGKAAVLGQLAHILRERRRIQTARRVTDREVEASFIPVFSRAFLHRHART